MTETLIGLGVTILGAGSGALVMYLFAHHCWRWLTYSIEYALWFVAGQAGILMVMLYVLEVAKEVTRL